jgi:succinate dehydrogenase/fumarate reductase flavoprotein subunit
LPDESYDLVVIGAGPAGGKGALTAAYFGKSVAIVEKSSLCGGASIGKMVVFQKWRWPCLHRPSKGIAIDKQANHDVMHLCGFREADRLADQAFDACPQCQVLAFNLLGVPFARTMHVGIQMPGVGSSVG